jgi:hypothetical protein
MKYLKIHIQVAKGGEMIYPDRYQSEIGDFAKDHLYYDENGESLLLLLIEDADYNEKMIRDNVEEVDEETATQISTDHEQKTETILDEAKIRRLEIKSRLGMQLTTEETDALDPTKPNAAFGVTQILADRITPLKSVEAVKAAKVAALKTPAEGVK